MDNSNMEWKIYTKEELLEIVSEIRNIRDWSLKQFAKESDIKSQHAADWYRKDRNVAINYEDAMKILKHIWKNNMANKVYSSDSDLQFDCMIAIINKARDLNITLTDDQKKNFSVDLYYLVKKYRDSGRKDVIPDEPLAEVILQQAV